MYVSMYTRVCVCVCVCVCDRERNWENIHAPIHPLCCQFKMSVTSLTIQLEFIFLFVCNSGNRVWRVSQNKFRPYHGYVHRNHGNVVLKSLVNMQSKCDVTAKHGNDFWLDYRQ
jgi:hypothetical protein